jgi:hypothetical protein
MAGLIMSSTQNPLLAIPTMLGIAGLAFGLSRFGMKRYADKKDRELRGAVERIAARVTEMTGREALPNSPPVRRIKRKTSCRP